MVAMLAAGILFKRSLSRGYDYVYPALGAGASIALPMAALADEGILGSGASLLVGALFGLAFGQSLPGTAREATSVELRELSHRMAGLVPTAQPARAPASDDTLWPRVTLVALGLALIAQAIWVVSTEWSLGTRLSSTADSSTAQSSEISRRVSMTNTREDHLTPGGLTVTRSPADPVAAEEQQKSTLPAALSAFTRALHYSPLRGDIWLMLAATSKQYNRAQYSTPALLKMSYYTAPSDLELLPLRLSVALGTDSALREPELRDLIKRDVSLVVMTRPAFRPAVTAAYRSASAEGKVYLENLISELDPSYLDNMRARRSLQGSR
jgi:hypothetical protein